MSSDKEYVKELIYQAEQRRKKRNKIILRTIATIVCVGIFAHTIIIPTVKKHCFIQEYGKKVYDRFGWVREGKYIKFGKYEQDNNVYNGKEDIEWLVLKVEEGRALVISKYALDCQRYHTECQLVSWKDSTLRKWLNEDFIQQAFTESEQTIIPTVTLIDEAESYPFRESKDQIFILSSDEVLEYFEPVHEAICQSTKYAETKMKEQTGSSVPYSTWWLRWHSMYKSAPTFSLSMPYASMDQPYHYNYVSDIDMVRPALWIDLKP